MGLFLGPLGKTCLESWASFLDPEAKLCWSHGPLFWTPRQKNIGAVGLFFLYAAEEILRSQPDPSPNAPRDQIRRKGPCCDLIPVCIGRGVRRRRRRRRLEGWKSGNLESGDLKIWEPGNLEIWKSGNLEIWKFGNLEPGNLEIWNPEEKTQNQDPCRPKCRQGLDQ